MAVRRGRQHSQAVAKEHGEGRQGSDRIQLAESLGGRFRYSHDSSTADRAPSLWLAVSYRPVPALFSRTLPIAPKLRPMLRSCARVTEPACTPFASVPLMVANRPAIRSISGWARALAF